MKAKTTFFSMALLIAFILLGCSNDDENTNSSSSSLVPQAPSGDKTQHFSVGSIVSDINVQGTNIKWYLKERENITDAGEISGTGDVNTPPRMILVPLHSEIKNNTTYYATQTINNIQSLEYLAVRVYIFER
jgi:uncharacterized lipoprotein NlpE involved in copper resistance